VGPTRLLLALMRFWRFRLRHPPNETPPERSQAGGVSRSPVGDIRPGRKGLRPGILDTFTYTGLTAGRKTRTLPESEMTRNFFKCLPAIRFFPAFLAAPLNSEAVALGAEWPPYHCLRLSPGALGPTTCHGHQISSSLRSRLSGWGCCATWCPRPFVLPYWSTPIEPIAAFRRFRITPHRGAGVAQRLWMTRYCRCAHGCGSGPDQPRPAWVGNWSRRRSHAAS
jgi:hypothetical protein